MIEITRSLARRFRAVLRKSLATIRRARVPLLVQTGGDGLRLCAGDGEVTVVYHQTGKLPAENVIIPSDALADFEGGKEDVVTLECAAPDSVQARWTDGGVPQVHDYAVDEKHDPSQFPALPDRWHPQVPSLLEALQEAVASTAKESVRYALQRVQIRGDKGDIVGTDGRQLLIQRGFTFPWKEDVLVPALRIFGAKEITSETPVALGRTDTHVGLRVGAWTFLLAIDVHSRFPRVEEVIPRSNGTVTTSRLSAE